MLLFVILKVFLNFFFLVNIFKCQDIAGNLDSEHDGEMKSAQIKMREEFIPFGNRYAGVAGYMPFKTETLHTAENSKIDSGMPHDYQSYLDKGIPTSNAQPYENPMNPSQFSDAWTVANVLASDNPKVRQGFMPVINNKGELDSWKTFEGGYAGNCPSDRPWGYYNSKWQCLPSDYKVPFDYILPDVQKSEDNTVGLKLLNSTFVNFYDTTGSQLNKVGGECWRGKASDRPNDITLAPNAKEFEVNNIAESSLQETLKNKLQSGTFTISVEGVSTEKSGRYTCAWNVTDTGGTKYEGGNVFKPRNWFKNRKAAEDIVGQVNDYTNETAESKKHKNIVRNALLPPAMPDYSILNQTYRLEEKVGSDFFNGDFFK